MKRLSLLLLLLLCACTALPSSEEAQLFRTEEAKTLIASIAETEMASQPTATLPPTPTPTPVPVIDPVDYYLSYTTQERYADWIRKLSGEEPVSIGGQEYTIDTRYSYAMFGGQENAKAYEYILETVCRWVGAEQVTLEPYTYTDSMSNYTWYNIVITFPGTVHPEEQLLFTAHFDSCVALTDVDPLQHAPGANDNGTGMAAMLEAIPVFAQMEFERTVKVVLFSGEENFQVGSIAYAQAHAAENIIGVINMDMFGYDGDGDRCFEIHAGSLPGSQVIGQALKDAAAAYFPDMSYDYFPYELHENNIRGDHTAFWAQEIPAVTVMENFSSDSSEGGCGVGVRDETPNWHLPTDYIADITFPYAYDIAKIGTIALLNLAGASVPTGAE